MNEEPKRKRMSVADPELQAMAKIDALLAELTDDARARTIDWIVGRQNQLADGSTEAK